MPWPATNSNFRIAGRRHVYRRWAKFLLSYRRAWDARSFGDGRMRAGRIKPGARARATATGPAAAQHPGPAVLTIGYEGAALPDFISSLRAAGVSRLIDVRELPISRRRGFSKSALSAALAGAGIGYEHDRALGAPREIRHRLREDGDLPRYFADFREYLATQATHLRELARGFSEPVALLCYERNPAECHRSVVADAIARHIRCPVQHLTVSSHGAERSAPRPSPRQGLPAG